LARTEKLLPGATSTAHNAQRSANARPMPVGQQLMGQQMMPEQQAHEARYKTDASLSHRPISMKLFDANGLPLEKQKF